MLHNRIVVLRARFAAISQHYIVIYSSPFTLRRKCIASYIHKGLPLYFYFYFYLYFVCKTSHIPGELIISVFNFLPTGLYGIVCFKREAVERFAGVSCVTRNPYVIGLQREKKFGSIVCNQNEMRFINLRVAIAKSGIVRLNSAGKMRANQSR